MTNTMSSKGRILPPIIGHRGACGLAPENTLASFRMAASLGVRCVEFDTRLTADGDVVVFHDDTLERTTNGTGAVHELTLEHIRTLDAGSWYSGDFADEHVPTLRETIKTLQNCGLDANVEIKPASGQEAETTVATCQTIRDCWPGDIALPVISSFRDQCLSVAMDCLPEADRALLIEDDASDWRNRVESIDGRAIHIWHELLNEKLMQQFTNDGYAVRVYTVNDQERALSLFDWGVESICTDYPDRFADM